MKLFEKTIGTNEIFNGHILNLRVDDVELPDGSFSKREIVSHKGAVAVLAIKDNQVIFVNRTIRLWTPPSIKRFQLVRRSSDQAN